MTRGSAPEGQVLAVRAHGTRVPFALIAPTGGAPRQVALEGDFAWQVGVARTCIGSWHEGEHIPCPSEVPVGGELQCMSCSGLERPECVFEPLCAQGAACRCVAFDRPHVVYIALYATLPKVGMTMQHRLQIRLAEQGADAGFIVAGQDGRLGRGEARRLEQKLASLHRVPEHRRGREVIAQAARPVPWHAVEDRAMQWQSRLARAGAHPDTAVLRIDDYPLPRPVPTRPFLARPVGTHEGRWLGGKGRYVYYQASAVGRFGAPVAALRIMDLVGRRVAAPKPPAEGPAEAAGWASHGTRPQAP